jgi:hypothetical protein
MGEAGLLRFFRVRTSEDPNLLKIPRGWDFHGTILDDEQTTKRQKAEAFSKRLFMAAFGGAALVGPMIIMTLHPTKATNLATTSAFVIVVAGLLAYVMNDATSKDVITATAAYAAVLVVFVGASAPVAI